MGAMNFRALRFTLRAILYLTIQQLSITQHTDNKTDFRVHPMLILALHYLHFLLLHVIMLFYTMGTPRI